MSLLLRFINLMYPCRIKVFTSLKIHKSYWLQTFERYIYHDDSYKWHRISKFFQQRSLESNTSTFKTVSSLWQFFRNHTSLLNWQIGCHSWYLWWRACLVFERCPFHHSALLWWQAKLSRATLVMLNITTGNSVYLWRQQCQANSVC